MNVVDHVVRVGAVVATVATMSGCRSETDREPIVSREFTSGDAVEIVLADAAAPVIFDIGFAFEVGPLFVDYLPGDFVCIVSQGFERQRTLGLGDSISDDQELSHHPIDVFEVTGAAGTLTCEHDLGANVDLRLDVWSPRS